MHRVRHGVVGACMAVVQSVCTAGRNQAQPAVYYAKPPRHIFSVAILALLVLVAGGHAATGAPECVGPPGRSGLIELGSVKKLLASCSKRGDNMMGNPLSQRLVPKMLARLGAITRRPLFWILVTAVMAAKGGSRGRRAALRGFVCYVLGISAGNLPKPLFGRAQPRHPRPRKPEIVKGAFPSGHAAAEVAYVFGASLEAPGAFLPLATMALLAHLSLVKAGKHYISDTLVGGMIGLVVVVLTAKAWSPQPALDRSVNAT